MKPSLPHFVVIAVAGTLLLAGCGGKSGPTTFYALSPIEPTAEAASPLPAGDVSIGIGPVTFPAELDRQRIVTRTSRNRLEINEFHRWGGSLEANFVRVLTENLSQLLQSNRVVARPWARYFAPEYRVVMDVRRFDGQVGAYASLNATWMIMQSDRDEPLVVRRTIIQEAVAGPGYEAFVAAQSAAAAAVSREIAGELHRQINARP